MFWREEIDKISKIVTIENKISHSQTTGNAIVRVPTYESLKTDDVRVIKITLGIREGKKAMYSVAIVVVF
ncbi:hypothetical protein EEL31_18075 [Brevibacillus laterosporus]|nr:hypothetical protein EEL31_18075 [Brevibacillus laterosporus]